MHNRSICFLHFNSYQRSEAAHRHVTDLSLMHLRDTDNWLSNTTRPIGANYRPTKKWLRPSADAITPQVGGRYRHVGRIFSLEWRSRGLVLGVQNRILEVWRTPLILNFGVRRRFQDVIYAVRRLNGSPDKGVNQPANLHSLISTFVVCCLDILLPLVSILAISCLWQASVAEQVSLSLTWLQTPKTGFIVTWLILYV